MLLKYKFNIKLFFLIFTITLISFKLKNQELFNPNDSTLKIKKVIEHSIEYTCKDSIYFDLENKKCYFYNNVSLSYEKLKLNSFFVEVNFDKNEIYSTGKIDSLKKTLSDRPIFTTENDEIIADWLKYNFKTKKGFMYNVVTEQSGGYLHSLVNKRLENEVIFVKNAKFTTCNLEKPHFYINLTKAKVIPKDKIITGPAYLTIEDVPLPLAIPFGYFPQKKKSKSGIILPEYGEEEIRGFFLKNGGYYWAINDYFDLSVTGEIFTNGSWGIALHQRYKKRYKFYGYTSISYNIIKINYPGDINYQKLIGYNIKWTHNQDQKSHPYRTISSNINISSEIFNKLNYQTFESRFKSSIHSNISVQQKIPNTPINLSINLRHNHNYIDSTINLIIPELHTFINRQILFKKIYIQYNNYFTNIYKNKERFFLKNFNLNNMSNGLKHNLTISTNLKLLNFFNISPTANVTEYWFFSYVKKTWQKKDLYDYYSIHTDTITKFNRCNEWNLNIPFSTQIYGYFLPKKTDGWFQGIRHTIFPSISFYYKPDYSKKWFFKKVQVDTTGKEETYSIFSNSPIGYPQSKKISSINLSINNNLEMKIKNKKDTLQKIKKFPLIDRFILTSGYNFAQDSLKLLPLSIYISNSIFRYFSLNFNSTHQWYTFNEKGQFINKLQYSTNKKFFNLTNLNFSLNISINDEIVKQKKDDKNINLNEKELSKYVIFNNKWNLNFSFNLNYSLSNFNVDKKKFDYQTVKSIVINSDFNLTENFKISIQSGYDFTNKQITYTNINIYRDLHCWEFRFSWVPFGLYKSYFFQINVKSQILQDLKLVRKKPFIDYF